MTIAMQMILRRIRMIAMMFRLVVVKNGRSYQNDNRIVLVVATANVAAASTEKKPSPAANLCAPTLRRACSDVRYP